MPELISIEEAARITGFPYEEIEDWVKSRKITSFHTRTGTRMVDPENLRDFIAHIEHLGIQKLYLQLVIQLSAVFSKSSFLSFPTLSTG